jgi:hypothetical protein
MREPTNTLFLDIAFGLGGQAVQYQRGAWSHPETDRTWALWPQCGLSLPVPPSSDDVLILLDVSPAIDKEKHPSRSVQIYLDQVAVLDVTLDNRDLLLVPVRNVASRQTVELTFDFDEPKSTLYKRPLAIAFHRLYVIARHDMVFSPFTVPKISDLDSSLVNKIETRTGLPARDMLLNFESLGHTCDFGLFQRQFGADPIGLLRFGGISSPNLIRGLLDRFNKLAESDSIRAIVAPEWGGEYMMTDGAYGMVWHSFLRPGQASPEQLVARDAMRLPFLRRLFLETLDEGEKIFVLRRADQTYLSEAEAVAAVLRLTSDCKLLWAVQEQGGEPGSVDILSPYLMRGHLDVKGVRGSASSEAWLSICANAYLLARSSEKDPRASSLGV